MIFFVFAAASLIALSRVGYRDATCDLAAVGHLADTASIVDSIFW
jgi:hypothetical protein